MSFVVFKAKHFKFFLGILLAIILLTLTVDGVASAQVFFGYPVKRTPIYCVQTENKNIAISFDAAWGAEKTEKIMEIVKEYNANATFFIVGFWADKNGEMVKKIDQNGFEIGTHSNTHPDMTTLSKEAMTEELVSSVNLIKSLTSKEVTLFRPPYGAYNNTLLDVCEELSLKAIQWDVDSLDWKGLTAQSIANRVLSQVKNGSIILFHNNSDNILEALPIVLGALNQKGYQIQTVGDLIYKENYTIDRRGFQIKN